MEDDLPDFEKLGFTEEQIEKWKETKQYIERISYSDRYKKKFVDGTEPVFTGITDNYAREVMIDIWKKARSGYELDNIDELWQVMSRSGARLGDSQRDFAEFISKLDLYGIRTVARKTEKFMDEISEELYSDIFKKSAELAEIDSSDGTEFFESASSLYKLLDTPQNDRLFRMGKEYKGIGGRGRGLFFRDAAYTFSRIEADMREALLSKTEEYYSENKKLGYSFMKRAGDVIPLIGKEMSEIWIETGDILGDTELKKEYYEESYSVLRQIRNRERLLEITRDLSEKNKKLAIEVFKAGIFLENVSDSVVDAWTEIGAEFHDVSRFVSGTKYVLGEIDKRTLVSYGKKLKEIEELDRDIADKILEKTTSLIRGYNGRERAKLFRMVKYALEEDERDAAEVVISNSQIFRGKGIRDIRKWISVSRGLDDSIKKYYFDNTAAIIDELNGDYIYDWIKTANSFGDDNNIIKFFRYSREVLPELKGKSTKKAFELTRDILKIDSAAAVEFYRNLAKHYNDDLETYRKLEKWISAGKEVIERFRDVNPNDKTGENYFRNTAEVIDALDDENLEDWKSMLLNAWNSEIRNHIIAKTPAVLKGLEDKELQRKYIYAVADAVKKGYKVTHKIIEKSGKFLPYLEKDEISLMNRVAEKIYKIVDVGGNQVYDIDPRVFKDVLDKKTVLEFADGAASRGKVTLAKAIIENARTIDKLDKDVADVFIKEAFEIYNDNFDSQYSPDALSSETYGSYLRTISRLSKLKTVDYLKWKQEYKELSSRHDLDRFLRGSEIFFRGIKEEDMELLFSYHARVYEVNKRAAIGDLEILPELSKLSPEIKEFVIALGEKLVDKYPSEMDNYLNNAVNSLKQLKSGEQFYDVYRAEQILENVEPKLAKAFIENFGAILKEFDSRVLSDWAMKGLEIYKSQGLKEAEKYFKIGLTRSFIDELKEKYHFVSYDEISGSASKWVAALLERSVGIDTVKGDSIAYTDNKKIYIPKRIDKFVDREKNKKLYWGLMDHEMAHIKYHSFDVDIEEALKEYDKPGLAKHINNMLEDGRIEYNLRKDYGGIIAEELDLVNQTYIMKPLDGPAARHPGQRFLSALLQKIKMGYSVTTVEKQYLDALEECYTIYKDEVEQGDIYDTWRATRKVYDIVVRLFPDLTEPVDQQPGDDVGDHGGDGAGDGGGGGNSGEPQPGDGSGNGDGSSGGGNSGDDGSENGDDSGDGNGDDSGDSGSPGNGGGHGGQPSGDQPYNPDMGGGGEPTDRDEVIAEYKYDEWDSTLSDYLYEFTTVKEIIRESSSTEFYKRTVEEYSGLRRQIMNNMAELKPAQLEKERRLPEGSDIDIDSYIDAWSERKAGASEMEENIFEENKKLGRDVAVVILVDQSASTYGETIKKEKEAMILMCEALQELGDRFAIYGFDSSGKDDVRVYRIKSFDEEYNSITHGRIEAMKPGSMTRMGPAVRHSISMLEKIDAETKIFIYLTDGEPNDYRDSPNKRGREYIFADIRKAIEEGEVKGIHSYAVTIDTRAEQYLPEMFGENNYTIIEDIEELPQKIADFYKDVSDRSY